MTIEEIKHLRETEDKVELKEAAKSFNYKNGRKSLLGYIVALANEGGGHIILGVKESKKLPHTVTGSLAWEGEEGKLEQDVYRDLKVRVRTEVLHDGNKRVLVVHVPPRPIGRYMTYEDVPLMRVGEELLTMPPEHIAAMLRENEPDFSATICKGFKVGDLDEKAVEVLKARYADKQHNKGFLIQSTKQVLVDLDLMKDGKLTYAALILLGKDEKIKELLPQCAVNLEYRDNPASIQFDKRNIFTGPYFLLIDELWKIIDARNKTKHIQLNSYIVDLPELNAEVIRESVNNAVAHRDYQKASEILIKHSPAEFSIYSHGGFPLGVTKDNILTINSTPRNRLLADVLTKTGLVERSGQGVDKIYYQTISEGKDMPSYNDSDLFQVTLRIPVIIKHPVFALFVKSIQKDLDTDQKLGVHHLITLAKIREQENLLPHDKESIPKLVEVDAIREIRQRYILSGLYNELVREQEGSDMNKIVNFINQNAPVKMGDIVELFENRLTRRQVNVLVYNLVEGGILITEGSGSATFYKIKKKAR